MFRQFPYDRLGMIGYSLSRPEVNLARPENKTGQTENQQFSVRHNVLENGEENNYLTRLISLETKLANLELRLGQRLDRQVPSH